MSRMISFNRFGAEKLFKSMLTPVKAKSRLQRAMNNALAKGYALAIQENWTPKLTGKLISSIRVGQARYVSSNVIMGSLHVIEIEYSRRQEFEHKYKGFYMLRAILVAQAALNGKLRDGRAILAGYITIKEETDRYRRDAATIEFTNLES